ncbi:MAG: 3'(2'),5'-bisphosphate nucleotidase CysQ [Geminicoccaceae bacterium]|nr:3'(2'),5'-bisphosphate nucleotidase CysQ [Geminicoccaceae bacterium]MCX8099674.1 3'(2'),5'-bisphosphate nucleotidase CysQ [Geminicoccaceae bacterium]MDW8371797.1 inositol monophosphatase family protein [Geminicoccaceae bacterium]
MAFEEAEVDRVRDAVREAGRIAMRFFGKAHARWEKGPGQIVTEADLAIDRYLHAALRRSHAEDGWLSEETVDDRRRLERRRVWVVDPIDGTRSFAEGVGEFAISVALLVECRPVLGFVYNPAKEELFEAVRGRGARLGGHPLRASAASGLEGARICASRFESRRRNFQRLLPQVELVTLGSLAYKLALVAAGRFDAYLSWRRTNDWDIAAALLLLEEAGAVATDARGGPLALNQPEPLHAGILAAPPALHAALLEATRGAYEAMRAGVPPLGPAGA